MLLLFLMSVSTTESLQFIKLPALASHYSEHKSAAHNLTFIDFLIMHYAQHDDNDNDQDKDNQLPFKGSLQNSTLIVSYFTTQPENPFNVIAHQRRHILLCFNDGIVNSAYLPSIWQPPKYNLV